MLCVCLCKLLLLLNAKHTSMWHGKSPDWTYSSSFVMARALSLPNRRWKWRTRGYVRADSGCAGREKVSTSYLRTRARAVVDVELWLGGGLS